MNSEKDLCRKLLVLDLDETLFYAQYPSDYYSKCSDIMPDFEIDDLYPVIERPQVHTFLQYAFNNFDVAVWTSAASDYALDAVAKLIGANMHGDLVFVYDDTKCVKHRPAVNDMVYYDPYTFHYLKDLSKLKKFGYPKEKIIVVDDSPEKWKRDYGNLICIPPFTGDLSDKYLLKLIDYLEELKYTDNIRKIEKRYWLSDK